jgi:hypothetical protein
MPKANFTSVRSRALEEPIEFDFDDETFHCNLRPSLGDTFDLMDVPDPTPDTLAECAYQLAKFIKRMLVPEDRDRWERKLHTISQADAGAIIEIGTWLVEQVTGRPFVLSTSSSGGQPRNGKTSKRSTGSRTSSRT